MTEPRVYNWHSALSPLTMVVEANRIVSVTHEGHAYSPEEWRLAEGGLGFAGQLDASQGVLLAQGTTND